MGKYRKVERLNQLTRGSIVKHVRGERPYVVTANYGDRVTAVDSIDITRLNEWLWFDEKADPKP